MSHFQLDRFRQAPHINGRLRSTSPLMGWPDAVKGRGALPALPAGLGVTTLLDGVVVGGGGGGGSDDGGGGAVDDALGDMVE